MNKVDLRLGDCIEVLKELPDNSVDSIVTDPPYHLTSIVKRFGKDDSAPAQFGTDGAYARASKGFMGKEWDGGDIAFRTDVWKECMRVLKPGGHMIAFSHSRTYHRMAVAIEDAGFEIRDQIMWVYGQGFPKSHNIGKALDKKGNSEWEGWGTALKPAHEPMVLGRKPLSEKSVAENVLKHGTGGINIDGSRIGTTDGKSKVIETLDKKQSENGWNTKYVITDDEPRGRFPANIIFDEEAGQLLDEQSGESKSNYGKRIGGFQDDYIGGASRFFYCPKATKKDRNEGIEITNGHPTVKPTDLMRYLINLVTPPNGTTLDPFMGSGSTGKAAIRCGVNFIGIEKEEEYMDIARARINHELNKI